MVKRYASALAVMAALSVGPAAAQAILPCAAATVSVTQTSSNVQMSKCSPYAIVKNIGSNEAFYQLGATNGTTATTSTYSLPANSFEFVVVGSSGAWLAAIAASGQTTTLRITQGFVQ